MHYCFTFKFYKTKTIIPIMQITDDTVVAMDYALKDDEGTLIDQSQPGQPLVYLHGHRNIVPGLEAALEGKLAGETAEVRIDPADGYARSTGKPGVVLVCSGPGATNTVTGIATAYMDSVPMIVISGNVATNLIGNDAFQECDIVGVS